jgi:hypothetical protein
VNKQACLDEVALYVKQKKKKKEELRKITRNLDGAILRARNAGATLREIEQYAEFSNVSVLNAERRALIEDEELEYARTR